MKLLLKASIGLLLVVIIAHGALAFSTYSVVNPGVYQVAEFVWNTRDNTTVRSVDLVNLQFYASYNPFTNESNLLSAFVHLGTNESNLSLIASNITGTNDTYEWASATSWDFEKNVTGLAYNTKYYWMGTVTNGTYNETTGVNNFYTPGIVQNNAWSYWDFRNSSLREYYTLKVGTNASPMRNDTTDPFGGGTMGVNASLSIDTGITNPTGGNYNWTYAGWVYINSSLGSQNLFNINEGIGGSSKFLRFAYDSSFGLATYCRDASGSYSDLSILSAANTPKDKWIFIAWVSNGSSTTVGTKNIYINDTVILTGDTSFRCKFDVGGTPNVTFSPGGIGPTAFWTEAASYEKLQMMYNNRTYFQWISNAKPVFGVTAVAPANNTRLNSSTSAYIGWPVANDPEGHNMTYTLYFGTNSSSLTAIPVSTNTWYNATGLTEQTTYYWRARVTDILGAFEETGLYQFNTSDEPHPNVTFPVNQTQNVTENTNINWTVTDANNATVLCTLYLNGTAVLSNTSALTYAASLTRGYNYTNEVVCTDSLNNTGTSGVGWFTTRIDVAPVFSMTYPNGTSPLSSQKYLIVEWNASNTYNDTLSYDFYFAEFVPNLRQNVGYKRWILGYFGYAGKSSTIYNYWLYAKSPYGAQTFYSTNLQTETNPAPVTTLSNLNSTRSNDPWVDLDMLGWCQANATSTTSFTYELYRNGTLNRSGDVQPQFAVSDSRLLSAGVDVEMSPSIGGNILIAAGGATSLAYTYCQPLSSCTQNPLESGSAITLSHIMSLRAGGDGKVLVAFFRNADKVPRYYLCNEDGSSCRNGTVYAGWTNVTDLTVAQDGNGYGIDFYAVNSTKLQSVRCRDDMTSCGSLTDIETSGMTSSDKVDYLTMAGDEVLSYTRGGKLNWNTSITGVTEVSSAGGTSSGNGYVAYVQGGVGKLMKTATLQTMTFAPVAANIDAKLLVGRDILISYSNGSATFVAQCKNDLSGCTTTQVASTSSSATAIMQDWSDLYKYVYVGRVNSGNIRVDQSDVMMYDANYPFNFLTIPQSEMVAGMNWSLSCAAYDDYYYGTYNSWGYSQRVGTLLSSGNKTVLSSTNVPPNVPTLISPVAGATNFTVGDTLFWSGSDPNLDNLTYNVYLGETNSTLSVVSANQTATNYTPGSLNGHTQYFWRIEAMDAEFATNSSIQNFTTKNRQPVLEGFTPSNGSSIYVSQLTNNLINWSVSDSDGDVITSFIYFGNTTSPTYRANTTGLTYTVPYMMTNWTYYWYVVAYDTYSNYTNSTLLNFFVLNRAPNAPTNLGPTNGGVTSIRPTLSWTASDPDGNSLTYGVYVGTAPGSLSKVANVASTTAYLPTYMGDLNFSTTYYWMIQANDSVDQTNGTTWSFTTGNNDAPYKPILQWPTNLATGSAFTTRLAWDYGSDPNNDPVYYDVYVGSSPSNMSLILFNQANTRHNIPSINVCNVGPPYYTAGCNYVDYSSYTPLAQLYWKVVSKDLLGGETVSDTWSYFVRANSTPTITLTSPANGVSGTAYNVLLQWVGAQAEGDALTYDVYVGSPNLSLVVSGTSSSSYYFTGLSASTTYNWRVQVNSPYGGSVNSSIWSFTTAATPPPSPPPVPSVPPQSVPTPTGTDPAIVIPITLPPPVNTSNTSAWENTTCIFNGTYYNGTDSSNCSFVMTNCGVLELSNCGPLDPLCSNCTYEGNITPTVTDSSGTVTEGTPSVVGPITPEPNPEIVDNPPTDGGTGGGGNSVVPPVTPPSSITGDNAPTNDCALLGNCATVGNGSGTGGPGTGGNVVAYDLYPGHNDLWVLEVLPDELYQVGKIRLGSVYGCGTNAAAAQCAGVNGIMVGNMKEETVNGQTLTIEEFACYNPATLEKIYSMTLSKSVCAYEIYTTDTNDDGNSEVATYDGVYDVAKNVRTKVITGSGPYDAMLPVDTQSAGDLGFVFTQRGGGSQIGILGVEGLSGSTSGGSGGRGNTTPETKFQVSYNSVNQNLIITMLTRKLPYVTFQAKIYKYDDNGNPIAFDEVSSADIVYETTRGIYFKGKYLIDVAQVDAISGSLRYRSLNYTIDDTFQIDIPCAEGNCRCTIASDGEFKYRDPVTNHGWITTVDRWGTPLNPIVDGQIAVVSSGVQFAHYVNCTRRIFEVDTRVAPSDLANYSVSVNVYGVNDKGQTVLVGGYDVRDDAEKQGQNLFVNDKDYQGLRNGLRPVGLLPTSSEILNGELSVTIISDNVKLKPGDVVLASNGVQVRISTLNQYGVSFHLTYNNQSVTTNQTLIPSTLTVSVGGQSVILSPTDLSLNTADLSDLKFSNVKMVFELETQLYRIYVDGTQQGGSTSFLNPVQSIDSVAVESRATTMIDLGAQVAFDYVRTQGTGPKFDKVLVMSQEQLAKMAALNILGTTETWDNYGLGCDPDVDLSMMRNTNLTRKVQTYKTVSLYCAKLYEAGLSNTAVCSIEALKDAITRNRYCYKEALAYCQDITFSKTKGLTAAPSEVAENIAPDQSLEGLAGCSAALTITATTKTVVRPLWNAGLFTVTQNMVPIMILVLIILLFIAGGRKK